MKENDEKKKIDDDCDGLTDEDFNAQQACTAGQGACQGQGVIACQADEMSAACNAVADPSQARPEVCNGIDDDCDGKLDENYTVTIN